MRTPPASASLPFDEGIRKVIQTAGTNILQDPERLRAFAADECDQETHEYIVFERNCGTSLLGLFANAIESGSEEELSRSVMLAEHYLHEQQAEDATTARSVALAFANGIAASQGQTISMRPGGSPPIVNEPPHIENAGTTESPGVTRVTQKSEPGRSVAPLVALFAIIIAVLVGIAIVLIIPRIGASSGSALNQTDSNGGTSGTVSREVVVSFDAGEADGGSMAPIVCNANESIAVPKNGFSYEGHTFVGWKDGQGNTYMPGDSMAVAADTTLVAQWNSDPCTVKFLGAGADGGTVSPIDTFYGESVTLPRCGFYRSDYEFDGWVDEQGNTYEPDDSVTVQSDTTFVAQWKSSGTTAAQPAFNPENFPRSWSGSYEGYTVHTQDNVIDRSVSIILSNIQPNGRLSGSCYVGIDERTAGATSGSYEVEGTMDWQTGQIHLYGTKWIDQGGLMGMGGFRGTVDPSDYSIHGQWYDPEGEAENGNWSMWPQ